MTDLIERLRRPVEGTDMLIRTAAEVNSTMADAAAEIERLKGLSVTEACVEIPAVGEYIAQIEKELAKAQKDAERYRWLRNNKYTAKYPHSEFDYSMHLSFTVSGVWVDAADPRVLDAQIDAAVASARKENGE